MADDRITAIFKRAQPNVFDTAAAAGRARSGLVSFGEAFNQNRALRLQEARTIGDLLAQQQGLELQGERVGMERERMGLARERMDWERIKLEAEQRAKAGDKEAKIFSDSLAPFTKGISTQATAALYEAAAQEFAEKQPRTVQEGSRIAANIVGALGIQEKPKEAAYMPRSEFEFRERLKADLKKGGSDQWGEPVYDDNLGMWYQQKPSGERKYVRPPSGLSITTNAEGETTVSTGVRRPSPMTAAQMDELEAQNDLYDASIRTIDNMLDAIDKDPTIAGATGWLTKHGQRFLGAGEDMARFIGKQAGVDVSLGMTEEGLPEQYLFNENIPEIERGINQLAYALARKRKGSGKLAVVDMERAREDVKVIGLLSSKEAVTNLRAIKNELKGGQSALQERIGGLPKPAGQGSGATKTLHFDSQGNLVGEE